MTWYWWTHWFWITSTAGVLFEIISMTASVETYPLNPPFASKEYNKKDKPLKFPLAAQTDIDDVFAAGMNPLSAVIRDSKVLHSKDAENISSDRISENTVADHVGNESVKQKVPEVDIKSNPPLEVNRTKGDVDSIISSNYSSLSTIPPVEIVSNTSQIDASELEEEANSTSTSHLIPDHSDFIDYEHNSSNESTEESLFNNHTSSAIDFVDETNHNTSSIHRPHALENITKEEEIIRAQIERQLGERGRKSKVLAEYRHELKYINFSSDTKNLLARSAAVSLDFDEQDDGNVSSEALSIQRAYILDAGAISGICFAVLGIFCAFTLAGIVLYRRRYLNKPQTLSEPDSSAYIDDSTIRDNSDEMYSLDNDSFLNSLEAMTIQNYWTDTVKHTKL